MDEPAASAAGRRRFVILAHQRPDGDRHYDLMIEAAGGLWTWSFPEPPATRELRCRRIFDHPRRFLTFQGPLRDGLGSVHRVDAGTCLVQGDPAGELALRLEGRTISGAFKLARVGEPGAESGTGEYVWRPVD